MKAQDLDENWLTDIFATYSYKQLKQYAKRKDDVGIVARQLQDVWNEYKDVDDRKWNKQLRCRIKTFVEFVIKRNRPPYDASGNPIAVLAPAEWAQRYAGEECDI